jgi:hypothetical protein
VHTRSEVRSPHQHRYVEETPRTGIWIVSAGDRSKRQLIAPLFLDMPVAASVGALPRPACHPLRLYFIRAVGLGAQLFPLAKGIDQSHMRRDCPRLIGSNAASDCHAPPTLCTVMKRKGYVVQGAIWWIGRLHEMRLPSRNKVVDTAPKVSDDLLVGVSFRAIDLSSGQGEMRSESSIPLSVYEDRQIPTTSSVIGQSRVMVLLVSLCHRA